MKKELSDQTRAIIAAVLSLIVIVGYSMFYKPQPPPTEKTTTSSSGTSSGTSSSAPSGTPGTASSNAATGAASGAPGTPAAATSASAAPAITPVAATAEQTIAIETDLYRVEFSNHGAVVRSWQLKKYTDSGNPPHTLDLVNAAVSQQTGGWPFAVVTGDAQSEKSINQGLYTVTTLGGDAAQGGSQNTLMAPAEVEFRWSDGHIEVTKRVKFDSTYIMELESSVRRDGQPVAHRVAWEGGFGDATAYRAAVQTQAFAGSAGGTIATKSLGAPNQPNVFAERPGTFDAGGIEDLYFAAAFLPQDAAPGQPVPAILTLAGRQVKHTFQVDGKAQEEMLPEVAVGENTSEIPAFRVYVGPKDIDTLKAIHPPLNLVQFGWFSFVAEPLFYSLRWLHRYIPNYGWAIVLMTIAINMVLYPLKVKSWRGMQKMQKVAPEIRSIQDRYKKYSMRDPRKAEMNKEVMAVYSREGINPLGSCLPQLVQMPIWFGLYRMLNSTIELRHAPWFGWIHDLSSRDPYYILPILMAVLMYAAQKMTPMTVTDPSQQRMMTMMPLIFGGMFVIYPVSSGLVLYIVTQNLVAVAQQWHLNSTSPIKPPPKGKKKIERQPLAS